MDSKRKSRVYHHHSFAEGLLKHLIDITLGLKLAANRSLRKGGFFAVTLLLFDFRLQPHRHQKSIIDWLELVCFRYARHFMSRAEYRYGIA
jgi:hypothetical protein